MTANIRRRAFMKRFHACLDKNCGFTRYWLSGLLELTNSICPVYTLFMQISVNCCIYFMLQAKYKGTRVSEKLLPSIGDSYV